MHSLLIFQNFGFEYSRYIILFIFAVLTLRKKIKVTKFDYYNSSLILIIFYQLMFFYFFKSEVLFKNVWSTFIYQFFAIAILHQYKFNKKIEILTLSVLIPCLLIIFYLSANYPPNFLVRDISISGNDNRIGGVYCILLTIFILVHRNFIINFLLIIISLCLFYYLNFRGALIFQILLLFYIVFIQRINNSHMRNIITSIITIFLLIMYFSFLYYFKDFSNSNLIRFELLKSVVNDFNIELQSHFSYLSLYQQFFLLGIFVYFVFYKVYGAIPVLFVFIAFASVSEFFTQIIYLSMYVLSKILYEKKLKN